MPNDGTWTGGNRQEKAPLKARCFQKTLNVYPTVAKMLTGKLFKSYK
jgi:hypothetical protein